jgi:transposase
MSAKNVLNPVSSGSVSASQTVSRSGYQSYAGIDVAAEKLDVFIFGVNQTNPCSFSVEQSLKGYRQLLKTLKKFPDVLVLAEATGGYEKAVKSFLQKNGIAFATLNPRRVRDFAKACNELAKTDKIDARNIARFGERLGVTADEPPREHAEELEDLLLRRTELMDMRTAELNRLRLMRSPTMRQDIKSLIKELGRRIGKVENELKTILRQTEGWKEYQKRLDTMKGCGEILQMTLFIHMPELGHLSRQEIAALTGVAPFCKDSGKSVRGKRTTWGGRNKVRKVLYMAALSASTCNTMLRPFYRNLLARGKTKKVALVAVMRKMIVILNAMARDHQDFCLMSCVPQKS